jgi:hypothetical protein
LELLERNSRRVDRNKGVGDVVNNLGKIHSVDCAAFSYLVGSKREGPGVRAIRSLPTGRRKDKEHCPRPTPTAGRCYRRGLRYPSITSSMPHEYTKFS